ncbi:MAG: prevent-host-death protein [Lachnospiraceae bacterium]|nr:prevent-host-death protein [Lachnospiraceae bacterium]
MDILKKRGNDIMPNIKPIWDLRNYTEVLKEVDATGRVYLTRNGHGEYAILTMAEIDELDRYRAANTLFEKLKAAEERAEREGWINADDLEKELGVFEG